MYIKKFFKFLIFRVLKELKRSLGYNEDVYMSVLIVHP